MVFLKVKPKKGKKPFGNNTKEGHVDDRFFNIALNLELRIRIYEDQSFNNPLEYYFAEDLEIIYQG